jgi:hypothetical protein
MATIKLISGSGGLATTETLLHLINQHPEGSTLKQLSQIINRPVSMINLCLKTLLSQKQVRVRLSQNKMQRLIFPQSLKREKLVNPDNKRSQLIKLLSRL